jgi:hypothetical protein
MRLLLQRLRGWDGWGVRICQVLPIILLISASSMVGVQVGAGGAAHWAATSPATMSAQTTHTPSGGAAPSGTWLTLWTARGTGDGTASGPLPAGAVIVWSCSGSGYLSVHEATPVEQDVDLTAWLGMVGACPMSGVSRAPAGHGLTLALAVTSDTSWTVSVRVWESGGAKA